DPCFCTGGEPDLLADGEGVSSAAAGPAASSTRLATATPGKIRLRNRRAGGLVARTLASPGVRPSGSKNESIPPACARIYSFKPPVRSMCVMQSWPTGNLLSGWPWPRYGPVMAAEDDLVPSPSPVLPRAPRRPVRRDRHGVT